MSTVYNNNRYNIETPTGFQPFEGIQRLEKHVYNIETSSFKMECSYDHPFITSGELVRYNELVVGDVIETKLGPEPVTSLSYADRYEYVYDILDVGNGHVFYTDGILSHNCQFIENGESAISGTIMDRWRKHAKEPVIELEDGHYKIWEQPNPKRLYSIGVDVSEGVGEAASVAQVLDITDLTDIRQVASYHDRLIEPHYLSEKLNTIANHWGRPYMAIERNNAGGQVVDNLIHTFGYDKFITLGSAHHNERTGIYSATTTKYKGISNMRYYINTLDAVTVNDIALVQEFETFIRRPNGTWKKKDGNRVYDDRVDAFFWALIVLDTEIAEQYYNVVSYDSRGKPAKIESIYFEESDAYQLSEYYQEDVRAPIPSFFGDPLSQDKHGQGLGDLMADGWSFI